MKAAKIKMKLSFGLLAVTIIIGIVDYWKGAENGQDKDFRKCLV